MAPEPQILKRKRSRPSDWWANGSIIASTPQRLPVPPSTTQDDSATEARSVKKRGRPSAADVPEPLVRNSPAVGNRGRSAKTRPQDIDAEDENRKSDELEGGKLLRRGRSSGIGEELRNAVASSRDEADAPSRKGKRGPRSAVEQPRPTKLPEKKHGARRRGRPAAVQADHGDDAQLADIEKPASEQNVRSKRGRPAMSQADKLAASEPTARVEKALKRGHPTTNVSEAASVEQEASTAADAETLKRRPAANVSRQDSDIQRYKSVQQPGRQGRRPVEAPADETQGPVISMAPKKKSRKSELDVLSQDQSMWMDEEEIRGRPRLRQSDLETLESEGRRRARISDAQSQHDLSSEATKKRKERGQKTSRKPQTTIVNVESASSKLTKAPSGSKKVSRRVPSKEAAASKSGRTKEPSSSNVNRQKSQPQKRTSNQKATTEPRRKRKEVENVEVTPAKRRRLSKAVRDEGAVVPEAEEPSMLYQHLKPVARKVSRQTIEAKWEPLPPAGADRIRNLLQDVQRPVIAHMSDERQKLQASTALQMVSRRLVHKISKGLPFPPATRNQREDDFDFEKILDHNRVLESQLTPLLHGNELLEAELAKEMEWLEADQETLAELEKNAKSETVTRNEAARKLHTLLLNDNSLADNAALKDDLGIQDTVQHLLPMDLDMHDNDLQGLTKGLLGHVDTINGNMKQVSGISEAIVRSKAAIQGTLFSHLNDVQYEEIVLGLEVETEEL